MRNKAGGEKTEGNVEPLGPSHLCPFRVRRRPSRVHGPTNFFLSQRKGRARYLNIHTTEGRGEKAREVR